MIIVWNGFGKGFGLGFGFDFGFGRCYGWWFDGFKFFGCTVGLDAGKSRMYIIIEICKLWCVWKARTQRTRGVERRERKEERKGKGQGKDKEKKEKEKFVDVYKILFVCRKIYIEPGFAGGWICNRHFRIESWWIWMELDGIEVELKWNWIGNGQLDFFY